MECPKCGAEIELAIRVVSATPGPQLPLDPLTDPNAAWRKEPASEYQLIALKKLGGIPRQGMTKGEASDLLEHYASDKKTYRHH